MLPQEDVGQLPRPLRAKLKKIPAPDADQARGKPARRAWGASYNAPVVSPYSTWTRRQLTSLLASNKKGGPKAAHGWQPREFDSVPIGDTGTPLWADRAARGAAYEGPESAPLCHETNETSAEISLK